MDDLALFNSRSVRARTHIENDREFVTRIILDRDPAEYPDPYLRDLTNVDTLRDYLTRIRQALNAYTPETAEEATQCADFYQRESERVNAQIGRLTFPSPEEYGLAAIAHELDTTNLHTGYKLRSRDMPWELYERLYALSLADLRYLAAYFVTQHRNKGGRAPATSVRILNAIRYVRNDPTVSLENIITFVPIEQVKEDLIIEVDGERVDIEALVPFSDIKRELRAINDRFDSLTVALAFACIGKLTNYHHPALSNGLYNSLETNISETMEQTGRTPRNIVAHEFFHAVQDITGTRDIMANGNAVEFDATPDDWEPIAFPAVDDHLTPLHEAIKHQWFRFRNGAFPELCEYQTKNIDEMYAVAFETYVESPDVLQNTQPEVYDILDAIVTDASHHV